MPPSLPFFWLSLQNFTVSLIAFPPCPQDGLYHQVDIGLFLLAIIKSIWYISFAIGKIIWLLTPIWIVVLCLGIAIYLNWICFWSPKCHLKDFFNRCQSLIKGFLNRCQINLIPYTNKVGKPQHKRNSGNQINQFHNKPSEFSYGWYYKGRFITQ